MHGKGFAQVEATLPFVVDSHPSAKSHVASEMLRRLRVDVQHFANEVHVRFCCSTFQGCGVRWCWCCWSWVNSRHQVFELSGHKLLRTTRIATGFICTQRIQVWEYVPDIGLSSIPIRTKHSANHFEISQELQPLLFCREIVCALGDTTPKCVPCVTVFFPASR